ncbi:MAG: lipoyl domain-containing protein [Gammaproteobacteria bacterium]|nr:lipoyl domain-containing protein [Gammaproteobacteria bacterium]
MELRLKIPKTAVSSETCKLIEWYVEVGEQISLEQPLYLIETEKTAIEIQSPVKGIIKSLAQIDETYDVGTEIATIDVEP